jgi:hypothetical protein
MLDGGSEALRSWVEEMFRDRSIVFLALYFCFLVLLRREPGGLAEADEP